MRWALAGALGVALAIAPVAAPAARAASGCTAAPGALAGYSAEQVANALTIMRTAEELGLGTAGERLGVMTAMGESGLRNLPYGDGAINPDDTAADSVGLFQQQHWWGPEAARTSPARAARAFFLHLETMPAWATMMPTAAAHAVQGNADPDFYAPFALPAASLVATLHGAARCADARPGSPGEPASPGDSVGLELKDLRGGLSVRDAVSGGVLAGLRSLGGILPDPGR